LWTSARFLAKIDRKHAESGFLHRNTVFPAGPA
jgi:hypothetical protein